jgi:creatinine amidohydrolase
MRIHDTNWFQHEQYPALHDRAVVPLGSTEQHAYLSLLTDAILAEKVALEAAEPLGIPVFPALPFGISPYFLGFPGTISLSVGTYVRVIEDILDSLTTAGFKRVVLVSGHGGNAPASGVARDWSARHAGVQVKYHGWWEAPRTAKEIRALEPVARHASWNENYPWTRLDGVESPPGRKEEIDYGRLRIMDVARAREHLGDGSFGGSYQRPDEEMLAVWDIAVAETREVLDEGWL